MAKSTNSGHHNNVSNFNKLLSNCISYGESYNPIWDYLKIDALQKLHTEAEQCIQKLKTAEGTTKKLAAKRSTLFEPLAELLSRVMGAVLISDVPPSIADNIQTIINTMFGRSNKTSSEKAAEVAKKAAGETVKSRSTSQNSFDGKINGLSSIITLLETSSGYATNETEISLESLKALHKALQEAHKAANTAEGDEKTARSERDTCLYEKEKNLVDTATKVKAYVKSAYPKPNTRYKQISGIRFIRYKN